MGEVVEGENEQDDREAIAWARRVPLELKRLPFEDVVRSAIEDYNARRLVHQKRADASAGRGFLNRIAYNYIRYSLSAYGSLLNSPMLPEDDESPAFARATDILARRIDDEITVVYPDCRKEVLRRRRARRRIAAEDRIDEEMGASLRSMRRP